MADATVGTLDSVSIAKNATRTRTHLYHRVTTYSVRSGDSASTPRARPKSQIFSEHCRRDGRTDSQGKGDAKGVRAHYGKRKYMRFVTTTEARRGSGGNNDGQHDASLHGTPVISSSRSSNHVRGRVRLETVSARKSHGHSWCRTHIRIQQDIAGLEVTMDDVGAVHVLERHLQW